jgi:hypothetical protein
MKKQKKIKEITKVFQIFSTSLMTDGSISTSMEVEIDGKRQIIHHQPEQVERKVGKKSRM